MHIHIIGSQWELTQSQFTAGNDDIYNCIFYERIALRKMNLIFNFLIISAAKKADYNHGLAITLSLVLNMLCCDWLTNRKQTYKINVKLLSADERI